MVKRSIPKERPKARPSMQDPCAETARQGHAVHAQGEKPKAEGIRASAEQMRAKLGVLETAIEHLNQGFCVFDHELRLVTCNSRYARMHGLPPELTKPGTPRRRCSSAASRSSTTRCRIGRPASACGRRW